MLKVTVKFAIAAAATLAGFGLSVAQAQVGQILQGGAAAAYLEEKALDALIEQQDRATERTEQQLQHQRECKETTGDYSC